jgi:crotonobetainyl-CoA:carnitine CoA-transferase CaiB-like acyl-CoA transferase
MPKYNLLNGVRVLDISVALAGPFAMQIMADLGAEVIKFEAPVVGDGTRDTVPRVGEKDGYYFMALNRNKKSVAIDLQTQSGREAFNELVKVSDVVFSNLRLKGLQHLGITYENLSKINPSIIFCCLNAFGKEGPYSEFPAFDDVVQAMSGISGITTDDTGAPVRTAVGSSDISAAVFCMIGILAALLKRKETGKGMEVSASMLGSSMAFITQFFQFYFSSHQLPPRVGTKHPAIAGFGFFKSKDGWVALGPCWSRITRVINKVELAEDPRYKEPVNRFLNKNALNAEIQEFFSQVDTADLIDLLRAEDIPAGPVLDLKQIELDPQVQYAKIIRTIKDPVRGDLRVIDCPIMVAGLPEEDHLPPPQLGQHTDEILGELLHYSTEKIAKIKRDAEEHSVELIDKSVRRIK